MSSAKVHYLGVHIASGKAPFMLAVYLGGQRLEFLESVPLEDVLQWAAVVGETYLAINAPSCLNRGLLARPELLPPDLPPPSAAQQRRMRLVEYELKQAGLLVVGTPDALHKCPRWMRRGFTLFQRLGEIGFSPYPTQDAEKQWLEICADAAFQRLLECPPYRARTVEGRLQRQLLLHEVGLPVSDPMEFLEEISRYRLLHGILPLDEIQSPEALNALLAAHIAYLAHQFPGEVMRYGNPYEGVITLPV